MHSTLQRQPVSGSNTLLLPHSQTMWPGIEAVIRYTLSGSHVLVVGHILLPLSVANSLCGSRTR